MALRLLRLNAIRGLRTGIGRPPQSVSVKAPMRYLDFLKMFCVKADEGDGMFLGTPAGVTYTPQRCNHLRMKQGRYVFLS
jgi:hypothetical protein